MSSSKSSMASKADKKPSNESTTTSLRQSSRRSNSLSSSPSLSSNSSLSSMFFPDDSPISPTTPLRFSGIPFSWEKLPGIPKKQNSKNKHNNINDPSSTISLLPLPPSSGSNSNSIPSSRKFNPKEASPTLKKYNTSESFRKDPFFAALVECSKDDDQDAIANHWKGSKVTNRSTITDRLGFISIYTSCKRTCAVSESIVYLPRSTPHYLLNRR